MSYCTYVYLKLVASLCCCCTSRWARDSWHARRFKLLKKFTMAQDKLICESDMMALLNTQRITKFL